MSRYTRWVRKQAKARALGQAPESHFSGSQTALVDESPPANPPVDEKSEHAGSCHASTGSGIGQEVPASDRGTPSHRPVPARHPGVGQPTSGSAGAEAGPGDSGANQREGERDRDQRDRRQPLNDGWLWRGKIQAGDIAVVVGEEGSGKSQIVADWIARVTSGRPFPGQQETGEALPPSDVLVFNTVEDFGRDVLGLVAAGGGDTTRVWQGTTQLLDWGHGHSDFPDRNFPKAGEPGGPPPETRVRLHTQDILAKLRAFLLRRPSIRLVVIDQLKHHVRTDSERVFEDCLFELLSISRETEVPFVCTQRPDAFRNAPGVRQYLKSDSLTGIARSIWRVTTPDDPAHGDRVLQCLKLNYHGPDARTDPWRLWQTAGEPMHWEPGNGEEFQLTRLEAKQRVLFHAKTFIGLYLQMFGGLADYQALRFWARREGISAARLFEATMVYNIGYLYEPSDDEEFCLRKIIGSWDQIRQREAIAEADRVPLPGPPEPKRRKKPAAARANPAAEAATPAATPDGGSVTAGPAPVQATTVQHAPVQPAPVQPAPVPTVPAPVSTSPAPSPAQSTRGHSSQTQSSPARSLESLRAQVARGEARLREFDLEGFRFIKPNFATTQLILDMEAELGSAEAMFAEFRKGLRSLEMYSPDEVDGFMEEYRRLYDIARQLHAPDTPRAAA